LAATPNTPAFVTIGYVVINIEHYAEAAAAIFIATQLSLSLGE